MKKQHDAVITRILICVGVCKWLFLEATCRRTVYKLLLETTCWQCIKWSSFSHPFTHTPSLTPNAHTHSHRHSVLRLCSSSNSWSANHFLTTTSGPVRWLRSSTLYTTLVWDSLTLTISSTNTIWGEREERVCGTAEYSYTHCPTVNSTLLRYRANSASLHFGTCTSDWVQQRKDCISWKHLCEQTMQQTWHTRSTVKARYAFHILPL